MDRFPEPRLPEPVCSSADQPAAAQAKRTRQQWRAVPEQSDG